MTTTLCCATSTLCQRKYSARQIRNFHDRTGNLSLLRGNDYSLRDVNLTTHLHTKHKKSSGCSSPSVRWPCLMRKEKRGEERRAFPTTEISLWVSLGWLLACITACESILHSEVSTLPLSCPFLLQLSRGTVPCPSPIMRQLSASITGGREVVWRELDGS